MRAAARAACAAAILIGGCAPEVSAGGGAVVGPAPQRAWVAEDPARGARVVLEALATPPPGVPAALAEEDLLARVAVLPPGQQWFRVHECGGAASGAAGALLAEDGARLAVPPPRAAASARDRLLYAALVRGADPPPVGSARRSRVVAGPPLAATASVTWSDGVARLTLQPRAWSARERAEFLGDLEVRAASESHAAAAALPLPDHE